MTEATKQRWLFGTLVIGVLVVVSLELRDIDPAERLGAVALLAGSAVPGFLLMWLREKYLRRTGKRPLDKPSGDRMNALIFASVGIAMIMRALMGPLLLVSFYGALAGIGIGAFIYVRKDLERLGKA